MDPKYKILVTRNLFAFLTAVPTELALGSEQFKDINSLLNHLSKSSPKVTAQTLEDFFNAGGVMMIAVLNGRLIGIACLVRVNNLNGVIARIKQVLVDPAHRGKGLARTMVTTLIELARFSGMHHVDLNTEPGRIEANKLYLSLGFVKRETNSYRLNLQGA